METRPRIKPVRSQLDKRVEWTSKILLFAMWDLTFYTFLKLPVTIPIHYNAIGQADNYGSKTTILILPTFATIIYFGLTELNKHPHLFNYAKKITVDNTLRQYTIATRMFRFLKLEILFIFLLIILFTCLTSMGVTKGFGVWLLPLTCGLLIIPVLIAINQSLKNGNTGS